MTDFKLTADNYYSLEADREYMSVHQYLDFAGMVGKPGCEARAMAKLKGEYTQETTDAMLVGSYVDSYFEGTLEQFKADNPQIFTQKGELKAQYKRAEKMIARCEKDPLFMATMDGEKQAIFTVDDLFGIPWKCKLDSYIKDKAIVDLKTTANLHQSWRVADKGYVSFPEYWNYTTQLAIYQKIVEINTGEKLPCYISAVTKEEVPEIAVINIDQSTLDYYLQEVKDNMPSVLAVKRGDYEPTRCEKCDYCKQTKVLTEPISMQDLIWSD